MVGTGVTHSVEELVDLAFSVAGLDWREHVTVDAAFVRPAEVDQLCADPAKAAQQLGWKPKTGFTELITMMVESDLKLLSSGPGGPRGRLVRRGLLVGRRRPERSGRAGADRAADRERDPGRGRAQHQLAHRAAEERPVGEPGHQPAADERGHRGQAQGQRQAVAAGTGTAAAG